MICSLASSNVGSFICVILFSRPGRLLRLAQQETFDFLELILAFRFYVSC